ncbi:MAG: proton-conducting transporter membrane subunit [Acidimicrobiia bacterium]
MTIVAIPLVLPLVGAAISLILHHRPRMQRAFGVGVVAATLGFSSVLLWMVRSGEVLTSRMGGWPGPLGIVLAADPLSAVMLVVAALMALAVLVYAIGSPRTADQTDFFHPLYLVMLAGIAMSFLTADLFNLFVGFEVTLTASYALITLGGAKDQVRHGMTYVVISLLASILFITAIALTYAATGTVNLADLALAMETVNPGLRLALGGLFLAVFGIKAAIFPLFFWLPDSYPTAPAPITAIFAGLLTKVGVYAIIRTHTLLFPSDGPSRLLLFLAGATMVVGVLGAIAQNDVKRILSFHIISQIGYMIFGLALFTVAGIAAAIFYMVHHIIIKTTLFLVGGLIEETTATGALNRMGGLVHSAPFLAGLFLLPALSLAGIPPLSGFVAKLSLVQAGLDAGAFVTVGVSLAVSLLTLFSMTKIWAGVFWGKAALVDETDDSPKSTRQLSKLMVGSTATLVLVSLAFVVGGGAIYEIGLRAGEIAADPSVYIEAVLAP